MSKTEAEYKRDNGIPPNAGLIQLWDGPAVLASVNVRLKRFGLRVKTKHRRNHGTGSYIWIEATSKESNSASPPLPFPPEATPPAGSERDAAEAGEGR